MKTASKKMLENEAILMGLFIVPMLFLFIFSLNSSYLLVFAFLIQLFIGIFQTTTAIIRYFRHGSQVRKWWLMTLICYLAIFFVGSNFLRFQFNGAFLDALWVLMLIIIPSSAATFYWIFTILQASGKYLDIDTPKVNKILLDSADDSDLLVDQILIKHKNRVKKL